MSRACHAATYRSAMRMSCQISYCPKKAFLARNAMYRQGRQERKERAPRKKARVPAPRLDTTVYSGLFGVFLAVLGVLGEKTLCGTQEPRAVKSLYTFVKFAHWERDEFATAASNLKGGRKIGSR